MSWSYIVIPFIALLTAGAASAVIGRDVNIWYTTINRPRWTPPGIVFGIVWTPIYALTAISALIVWNSGMQSGVRFWGIVALFLVNAVLNFYWTYLFFRQHKMLAAVYESFVLWLTVAALMIFIWPLSLLAAELLAPYLIWVAFATILNYRVWVLNKDGK